MKRLGLTGGIGSGKSTVSSMLALCGAAIIDADAIARSVTAPLGSAVAPIRREFGAGYIDAQGALDRDAMRRLAFNDPGAKARLEAIIHPLVGLEIERQALSAQAAGTPCAVFDVPLLVESGRWAGKLDRVLVLDCRAQTQIARVTARSGLASDIVAGIIAAQASRAQRLSAADFVIFNDGLALAQLQAEVEQLAKRFGLSLAPPEKAA